MFQRLLVSSHGGRHAAHPARLGRPFRYWRARRAQFIIRVMKIKILEKLDLPPQSKVEAELLKLLAFNSRPLSTTEIYRRLADTFGLTASQRVARRQATRLDPALNWPLPRVLARVGGGGGG